MTNQDYAHLGDSSGFRSKASDPSVFSPESGGECTPVTPQFQKADAGGSTKWEPHLKQIKSEDTVQWLATTLLCGN